MLNAEAGPIGAQIDAAKVKAEHQLKERWLVLEEHVKANQQEKTPTQATLQELTSKAKMELERETASTTTCGTSSTENERDGTTRLVSLGTLQVTQQRAQQEERHECA